MGDDAGEQATSTSEKRAYSPGSFASRVELGTLTSAGGPMPSVWRKALEEKEGGLTVSEACKFTAAEQEGLIAMRRRLLSCVGELAELEALLQEKDDAPCGLPRSREQHRTRMCGHASTFSLEDAKRDFETTRLVQRLQDYVDFCEAALADRLEPAPGIRQRQQVAAEVAPGLAPGV